jgi:hypothetical protein
VKDAPVRAAIDLLPNRKALYTKRTIKFVVTTDRLIATLHLAEERLDGPSIAHLRLAPTNIRSIVAELIGDAKRTGSDTVKDLAVSTGTNANGNPSARHRTPCPMVRSAPIANNVIEFTDVQ